MNYNGEVVVSKIFLHIQETNLQSSSWRPSFRGGPSDLLGSPRGAAKCLGSAQSKIFEFLSTQIFIYKHKKLVCRCHVSYEKMFFKTFEVEAHR